MQNSNSDLFVPRREFGNSGVKISKLCLGGASFLNGDPQAILEKALRFGVDCWEIVSFTGSVYRDYFFKNPEIRKHIFLVGKVFSTDPIIMEEQLNNALEKNGIETIDFLAIHQISSYFSRWPRRTRTYAPYLPASRRNIMCSRTLGS